MTPMDPHEERREARREEREQRRQDRQRLREEHRARARERWAGLGRTCQKTDAAGRQLMGILLIAVGGLFILSNLGIIYVEDFWELWPVILIVMGLSQLSRWRAGSFPVAGFVLTGLGAAFLLRNIGIIQISIWRYFWPALLIIWGVAMLYRRSEWHNPTRPGGATSANIIDEWVVFGGVEKKVDSQDFEGGHAFAAFGGVELDLRNAATKKDEIFIEASAMFGGVEIKVPDTWNVTVQGTGIFGGYEDGTAPRVATEEKRPRLVVSGNAIFGGVEIKN